ncbi:MAG TPA: protein-methionine-sulfoxide reductase heme-binding subunit MsrQ [Steroidobacteraceae bacterium]|nr:protein-methionine-sulfoxide reductase heme-binding subunit MsrQ [Steroidobacteraceae bacterium]
MPIATLAVRAFGLGGATLGTNPVATLTDQLGLWALRLLLATLALTPLRILTGSARWLLYRRMLGLAAFGYLTLHLAMYFAVDQSFDWRVLLEDIAKRRWITLGFTAFVLLVPLAATSTRAAQRRLGRRWQRLHYAIYPAAVLGCWHYYWQVKRDVRAPLVYAAVLALLLGMRAVRAWRRRGAGAVLAGQARA